MTRWLAILTVICLVLLTGCSNKATVTLQDGPDNLPYDGYTVTVVDLEPRPNAESFDHHSDFLLPGVGRPADPPNAEGHITLEPSAEYRRVRVVWPEWIEDCEFGGNAYLAPGQTEATLKIGLTACA